MKQPIHFPRSSGEVSRQAHADLPPSAPYEREVSREGFFGPATHLHHKHPPTGWIAWEGALKPRAYDLNKWEQSHTSLWLVKPILKNSHCEIAFWQLHKSMKFLLRNADGDQLLFTHRGSGSLFSDYGHLSFSEGDYLLIPKGTLWRIECETACVFLTIEATQQMFGLPDKGIVGAHAIFDPACLTPSAINDDFLKQQDENIWHAHIKRLGTVSTVTYPFNPLDALGWHGEVCTLKLNWRDIRPIMSHRYHIPPSAHTTFQADHFVVCTFVPRPFETDPGALKVPFYHSNDDYDEILFYHSGEFFSRDHIYPGMMSFHPAGFSHGPHPKAYANAQDPMRAKTHTSTNEVAVMIDTRYPMHPTETPNGVEWLEYANSWRSPTASQPHTDDPL